ncbi:MAG: DNRLRE domain-containing protein [Bacteroidetes bacterium]|jgi:hypothetical protein|nr:DNRLRE domain-containing protein [Bacteroidota bacterium]
MDNGLFLHANAGVSNNILTVAATEDTYVMSEFPNNTFGNNDTMIVKNSATDTIISYVKFDLSDLQLGEISLVRAYFLAKNNTDSDVPVHIHMAENNWNEDSLNWNNKVKTGKYIGEVKANDDNSYKLRSIDLTLIIKDSLANGVEQISLALQNPEVDNAICVFHTSDKHPAYPPILQIIHDSDIHQFSCNGSVTDDDPKYIDNRNHNRLRISPNPVRSQLCVKGTEGINQYTIISYDGRKISQGKLSEDCIDISRYDPGMYMLKVNMKTIPFVKE